MKEREVEIRNVELTALSKAKFYQIERLKKKLSDAEENLVSLCFGKCLLLNLGQGRKYLIVENYQVRQIFFKEVRISLVV